MVQVARDPGLVEEHPLEPGVVGELGQDALERHPPLEAGFPLGDRLVDVGHPSGGDGANEPIAIRMRQGL